jgi:hypothetical protein
MAGGAYDPETSCATFSPLTRMSARERRPGPASGTNACLAYDFHRILLSVGIGVPSAVLAAVLYIAFSDTGVSTVAIFVALFIFRRRLLSPISSPRSRFFTMLTLTHWHGWSRRPRRPDGSLGCRLSSREPVRRSRSSGQVSPSRRSWHSPSLPTFSSNHCSSRSAWPW